MVNPSSSPMDSECCVRSAPLYDLRQRHFQVSSIPRRGCKSRFPSFSSEVTINASRKELMCAVEVTAGEYEIASALMVIAEKLCAICCMLDRAIIRNNENTDDIEIIVGAAWVWR